MDIIVGLSGGVDSSVTALLLKNAGHHVTGVTMAIWGGGKYAGQKGCFTADKQEDRKAAEEFCRRIDIPYMAFDCSADYEKMVLAYFREEYLAGRTPNPCVRCNSVMKFGLLPKLAQDSGIRFEKFATGHYAGVGFVNGRYCLRRAADGFKDQSYFLYRLSQQQLERQLFPLGGLTKSEVRRIAAENGFAVADKPDSQDFYDGQRSDLLGESERPGNIVDETGKVLGRHTGFWNYTIGQRKGLCIAAPMPLYVTELNACKNEVVVGPVQCTVRHSLIADNCNWISIESLDGEIPVQIKVRSAGRPLGGAVIRPLKDGTVEARFDSGIAGVAPGQSAVFYQDDIVVGGGIIREIA